MRAFRAVVSMCVLVSAFPADAAAQVRGVTMEVSVPNGANGVSPSLSGAALTEFSPATSLSLTPSFTALTPALLSPSVQAAPSASVVQSPVENAFGVRRPSVAFKAPFTGAAASKTSVKNPEAVVVPKALAPVVNAAAKSEDEKSARVALEGRALFDGALLAASVDDPTPDEKPVAVGRSPRKGGLPRRFTSRLARWTGFAAVYSVYRDGVLVQKYAAQLVDKSASTSKRASAARLLGALGRLESVPVLAQAHIEDPMPRVRRLALESMLSILGENAPRLIRSLKAHPRSGSREYAAATLAWLVARSESPAALEALEALGVTASLDRTEDVRLAAISALADAQSAKGLSTLEWLKKTETRPHMRSALELALTRARARGRTAFQPYRPPVDEFGSATSPLHEVALKRSLAVAAVFVAVVLVGAFVTGNTALKADGMHLAADQLINAAALVSIWIGRRPPNSRKSYGYLKVESVVGLLGAMFIAFMGWEMATEAWHRFFAAAASTPTWSVALFALASMASNVITVLILRRHHGDSLSVKGAFLHAATDAVGSFGVIVSVAAAILLGWAWVEPLAVALIVVLIVRTAWELGRPAWNVLIDAVPEGVDLDRVEADLLTVPGAAGVHDLHVWSLNSTTKALTATLFVKPGADHDAALATAKALLREKHGIAHSTLQVETIK